MGSNEHYPLRGRLIDLFAVYSNTDSTEGRGQEYIASHHTKRGDADVAAKGAGVMGTVGRVARVPGVAFADGAIYCLGARVDKPFINDQLRAKALAKLTSDERAALGLKDV